MGLPSPLRSARHPLEVRCFGSLKPAALDFPSSSLYHLQCSSGEICLLFVPLTEMLCLSPGFARNGSWQAFSFRSHIWIIFTSKRGRMQAYATIFIPEVQFCHLKHFFLS